MTQGCFPSREDLLAIRQTTIDLLEIAHDWNANSEQPGYPSDMGLLLMLTKMFELERALNPARLPWGDRKRYRPDFMGWPFWVSMSLWWLRDRLDLLMASLAVQTMAIAKSMEDWAQEQDLSSLEQLGDLDGLTYFEQAVERLGAIDGSTIRYEGNPHYRVRRVPKMVGPKTRDAMPAVFAQCTPDRPAVEDPNRCPVELDGPGRPAKILGILTDPFIGDQFKIIEALVRAYPGGLSEEELVRETGCPDARGIFKRTQRQNEEWGSVLKSGKGGYRLSRPGSIHGGASVSPRSPQPNQLPSPY